MAGARRRGHAQRVNTQKASLLAELFQVWRCRRSGGSSGHRVSIRTESARAAPQALYPTRGARAIAILPTRWQPMRCHSRLRVAGTILSIASAAGFGETIAPSRVARDAP